MTLEEITKLLIPERWQEYFEIRELKPYPENDPQEWRMVLKEKSSLIPKELEGYAVVQNGYMNQVEVLDFTFRGMPMYLRFVRRRWKIKGENKSYFNQYEFHPSGMKATHEFGAFLKELDREELDEFFNTWKGLRHIQRENF